MYPEWILKNRENYEFILKNNRKYSISQSIWTKSYFCKFTTDDEGLKI